MNVRNDRKVKQCFVPYCGNNSFKTPNKVFIASPSIPEKRKKWFKAASKAYKKPLRVLTISHCCEDHFSVKNDFYNWMEFKTVGTRLKLRPDAIPHIFKPKPDLKKENFSPFLGFLAETRKRKCSDIESSCEESSESEITIKHTKQTCSTFVQTHRQRANVEKDIESIIEVSNDTNTSYESYDSSKIEATADPSRIPSFFEIDICTSSEDEVHSSSENDNVTKSYTTIETLSHFDVGLSKAQSFLVKLLSEQINCSHRNILLILKKIKHNDNLEHLSRHFSLSITSVYNMFEATIPKVAQLLKQFIIWPNSSNMFLNLPVQCRSTFLNIESIIDFFEVPIDTPISRINRSLTWSEQKEAHTIKYFISVNPNGLINFISPGYGGRTSEEEIIQNCGYLDVLPSKITVLGNTNLVDLTPLLTSKNCKFMTQITVSEQLREETNNVDEQISFLLRQLTSTICKLRDFQILNLNDCVETSCIPLLDFIVIIACGLVNLQEPADATIIANDCAV